MELMIRHTKRTIIFLLAILFVILGFAGLVLPLIPGLVFFALSLIIFSIFFPTIGEWVRRHTIKYPRFHAVIVNLDERVRRMMWDL